MAISPADLNLAPLENGVRIVFATGQCKYDEDPELPWKVHVFLRPPEFMVVTFVMLHGGTEEIILQAESLYLLENVLFIEDLERHPRFRRLVITGPDNLKIERSR